jgi:two-component system, OmpR family, alkaline phosphatase synthesis response regulator PhoP
VYRKKKGLGKIAMAGEHILVVEDDVNIMELVRYNVTNKGYKVTGVATGENALMTIGAYKPDLVVLDLMLPGIDGITICEHLKKSEGTKDIPIIMVTAKGEDEDIVKGLEAGADDYVTKPFSIDVLLARIKAVLRRAQRKNSDAVEVSVPLKIHELSIDPARHKVSIKGTPIELTLTEYKILHYLARHPGWVFTRYQIVEAVRGEGYVVTERSVDVLVFGLRKKLGEFEGYIETVRGIGYRFRE